MAKTGHRGAGGMGESNFRNGARNLVGTVVGTIAGTTPGVCLGRGLEGLLLGSFGIAQG